MADPGMHGPFRRPDERSPEGAPVSSKKHGANPLSQARDWNPLAAVPDWRDEKSHFRTVVENLSEGLIISDLEGRLLHWNAAALAMYGFANLHEVLRALPEFQSIFTVLSLDGVPLPLEEWPLSRLIRGETVHDLELRIRRNDSDWERIFNYGGSVVAGADGRPILAFLTITDITDRKRTDFEREATIDFLHLVSEGQTARQLVRSVLEFFRRLFGCEAAGLQVREGDTLPYYESVGNPPAFVEHGRRPCSCDDDETGSRREIEMECLCGGLIEGTFSTDTQNFSPHGSFWTASSSDVIATCDPRPRPRASGCLLAKYESVALIPLRLGSEPLGLIYLMDRRPHALRSETVAFCERLADALAVALARARAEDALRQALADLQAAKLAAEEARAGAEEASQAKDHFLAILSHELRTPLMPVLTGLLMLEMEAGLSEDARSRIQVMRRNVELESRLIDDLLDLTRVARGTIALEKRNVDLPTVIERAVEVCLPEVQARGLKLTIERSATNGRPVVEGDAARLQQVVWNLLRNAVKFTPVGGQITISCGIDNGHAVVAVRDTGIGIEPSVLPFIFDAFVQADGAVKRQFGGLGLGLAISKALVEAHGGTIDADSAGAGRGATFRFRLPLLAIEPERRAGGEERRERSIPQASRKLRVLLVEDHADTLELLSHVLEIGGHEVGKARTMASALELASSGEPFDVLISDLGLPDGSGLALMNQLRERGLAIPGIALSGYGQEQDIERSLAVGFRTHLVKPADPRLLLEALAKATAV